MRIWDTPKRPRMLLLSWPGYDAVTALKSAEHMTFASVSFQFCRWTIMHALNIMWLLIYPNWRPIMTTLTKEARDAFSAHGGTLRTTEALAAGIHPRTLYAMRNSGQIEALA